MRFAGQQGDLWHVSGSESTCLDALRTDELHFRKDVAVRAGDELLKALAREARWRYPDLEAQNEVLLVLAAGWNTEEAQFDCLDEDGHAWRKTELTALTELCALNGLRFSNYHAKCEQLLNRCAPHAFHCISLMFIVYIVCSLYFIVVHRISGA